MAESGAIRLDGRRVDRAHAIVRDGAVLALVFQGEVRVVRVTALPRRRGPPAEAAQLWIDLSNQC